jgi:hypothetical protein
MRRLKNRARRCEPAHQPTARGVGLNRHERPFLHRESLNCNLSTPLLQACAQIQERTVCPSPLTTLLTQVSAICGVSCSYRCPSRPWTVRGPSKIAANATTARHCGMARVVSRIAVPSKSTRIESSGLEGPSGRRPPGHMRPGRGGRPGVRWLCALPLFLWALFSGCQWGRSSRPSRQVQVRERSSRSGTLPRRPSRTRRSVAGRAPSASASESESARRGHRH